MYTRFPSLIVKTGASNAYDSDAQSFITAAGITNTTQKNAINQLVLDYKFYGIWTSMYAIYPFVGGTASSHSYNLKNPAQFQITNSEWTSGVTHNSNGITSNGSTGYGNTGLVPSTTLTQNSCHLSFYSRTNNTNSGVAVGTDDGSTYLYIIPYAGGSGYSAIMTAGGFTSTTIANTTGAFHGNRSAFNAQQFYRNGSSIATDSTNSSGRPNNPIFICCNNQTGSPGNFTNKNLAMVTIGLSLNSTGVSNKYTADQAFQTALGRQV